jgi:flagellar biosynthetic protein FliR
MHVDISFLPGSAAACLLTFERIGTMVMLLPGVGEQNMPARVRVTIVLLLAAVLLPAHQNSHSVDLIALWPVLVMLFQEIIVGAVLGLTARLAISALQIAGAVVEQQMGLSHRSDARPARDAGRQFSHAARHHATVDVDQAIPPGHYKAFGEVINYVMRLRRAVSRSL